jgi:hypothetical protein
MSKPKMIGERSMAEYAPVLAAHSTIEDVVNVVQQQFPASVMADERAQLAEIQERARVEHKQRSPRQGMLVLIERLQEIANECPTHTADLNEIADQLCDFLPIEGGR